MNHLRHQNYKNKHTGIEYLNNTHTHTHTHSHTHTHTHIYICIYIYIHIYIYIYKIAAFNSYFLKPINVSIDDR